jgi:Putative transposase
VSVCTPTAPYTPRLDCALAMSAFNEQGRERLVRYCLRGPLALERLSRLRDGSLAYRTKYGRGQRTHLVMTPVEFLARMASLGEARMNRSGRRPPCPDDLFGE